MYLVTELRDVQRICLYLIIWGCWIGGSGCGSGVQEDESRTNADVILHTEKGDIAIDLFDETPRHRDNFLKLAREGFFDSLAFHRVISEFMIQTGDPRTREEYPQTDTTADDGPGYTLAPEFGPFSVNTYGRVGAARLGDDKNPAQRSAGSQFYIVASGMPVKNKELDSLEQVYTGILRGKLYEEFQALRDSGEFDGSFGAYQEAQGFQPWHYPPALKLTYLQDGGAPWLDFRYTVFGQVVSGLEVIDEINRTATDEYDRPRQAIRVIHAEVLVE